MPGAVPERQDAYSVDQEMRDVTGDTAAAAPAPASGTNGSTRAAHAEGNGHDDDDDDDAAAMRMHTDDNSPGQNPAPAGGNDGGGDEGFNDEDGDGDGSRRIRILPGSTDTAASFQFDREDHTLGNALRYMIMKNPVVEFCGYTIPHPSEDKMNLRIQTWDDASVYDVLEKGLDDLMNLCDVVTEKFTVARDGFRAR